MRARVDRISTRMGHSAKTFSARTLEPYRAGGKRASLPLRFPLGRPPAQAPVAQLDRALPSEGKGHTFESCRVRHLLS